MRLELVVTGKKDIKNFFQHFACNLYEDENKVAERREFVENFLTMMNREFGKNGLYFEVEERIGLVNDLLLQDSAPPLLNIRYRGKQLRVGFLDIQKRTLFQFCDKYIEEIEEKILNVKRETHNTNKRIENLTREISKKRRNIFFRLFKRKEFLSMQQELTQLNDIIFDKNIEIESFETDLNYEVKIKESIIKLSAELIEFGIYSRSV